MVEDHEHFASAQATPKEQIMSARPKSRTAAVNGRLWGARARNWAAPRASPLPWMRVVFTFVDDLLEALKRLGDGARAAQSRTFS